MSQSHNKYLLVLRVIFAIEWVWLAISPHDRADWALENVIVVALVILLALLLEGFDRMLNRPPVRV